MSNYLTFEDLNLDKNMFIAISATMLVSHLHLCEKESVLRPYIVVCLSHTYYADKEIGVYLDKAEAIFQCNRLTPGFFREVIDAIAYTLYMEHAIKYEDVKVYLKQSQILMNTLASGHKRFDSPEPAKNTERFIGEKLSSLLPVITRYKTLTSKRPFGNPSKVLDFLPDNYSLDFIFNLDKLS